MEQPKAQDFQNAKAKILSMAAAVRLALAEIAAMSDAPVDAVAKCEKGAEGAWIVAIDLVESPARMGENDLLARYELHLEKDCSVSSIERIARYRREDRNAP